MSSEAAPQRGWRDTLSLYTRRDVRPMLFFGFSSGLPFLLVFSTLSAWLTQSGISRATIGHLSWAGLAYSVKYFWSPVVDRLPLPLLRRLGRRRSWMLLAQLALVAALALMSASNPAADIGRVAWLAVSVAFASATQDIAVDAYRIECGGEALQAALAAAYQLGYRIALIVAGAGALYIAADHGWQAAYLSMAALMSVGLLTTLLVAEPPASLDRAVLADEPPVIRFLDRTPGWPQALRHAVAWFIGAVICPFTEFLRRFGLGTALLTLLFIALYRASDFTMGVMANNFYLTLGFTLKDIANVSKLYGVVMNLIGVFLGAMLIARIGLLRTLLLGLVAICIANLGFSLLAQHPQAGLRGLVAAISVDNITIGIEGTAFVVYLSKLTSARYTATQYALLGMAWSLPCKALAGKSGEIVDALGYPLFFVYTAVLSVPAMLLALWLLRHSREDKLVAVSSASVNAGP